MITKKYNHLHDSVQLEATVGILLFLTNMPQIIYLRNLFEYKSNDILFDDT